MYATFPVVKSDIIASRSSTSRSFRSCRSWQVRERILGRRVVDADAPVLLHERLLPESELEGGEPVRGVGVEREGHDAPGSRRRAADASSAARFHAEASGGVTSFLL